MKALPVGAVFAGMWLAVDGGPADTLASRSGPEAGAVYAVSAAPEALTEPATAPSSSVPPATLTEVVQQYCVTCHNDQLRTGNLSLQDFSVEDAEGRAQTAENDDPEAATRVGKMGGMTALLHAAREGRIEAIHLPQGEIFLAEEERR